MLLVVPLSVMLSVCQLSFVMFSVRASDVFWFLRITRFLRTPLPKKKTLMALSLVTVVATDSFELLDPRRKSGLLPWILLTYGMLLHLVGSSLEQVPHGRAVLLTEWVHERTVVSTVLPKKTVPAIFDQICCTKLTFSSDTIVLRQSREDSQQPVSWK